MNSLSNLTDGQLVETLIGMYDINGFTRISRQSTPQELMRLLQEIGAVAGQRIAAAEGLLIKYIGDAALFVFAQESADEAVDALFALKAELESLLAAKGFANSITFSLHAGEIVFAKIPPIEAWDIGGRDVNVLWTLDRNAPRAGFVISPQAFRKLGQTSRKRFHKHTPPIVYLSEKPSGS